MNIRALGALLMAIIVDGTVAVICGHFKIGHITGCISYTTTNTVPSGGFEIIGTAVSWFGSAITFQLPGYALLSLVIWFFNIMAALAIILIIRQGN